MQSLAKGHPAIIAMIGILIALVVDGTVIAQQQTNPIPANARENVYTGGWECNPGFRETNGECLEIVIPENAYSTNRAFGKAWECRRGYRQVDGASCVRIEIPSNAFLSFTGNGWECDRGFRRVGKKCVETLVPENGHLTTGSWGTGWKCNRGFRASGAACLPIAIPDNGYATNLESGSGWRCERGFTVMGERCIPVSVPENAYFDEGAYPDQWKCERGFEQVDGFCISLSVPENAHLGYSGNRWECDKPYIRKEDSCVQAN